MVGEHGPVDLIEETEKVKTFFERIHFGQRA
jgi:hypothetical protein